MYWILEAIVAVIGRDDDRLVYSLQAIVAAIACIKHV